MYPSLPRRAAEGMMRAMGSLAYYQGLFERGKISDVAAMITWCRGAEVGDVIVRLGAEAASGMPNSVREAFDREPDPDLAIVAEIGQAVLVAEPFGWAGSQPEVAKRLSSGGALVVSVCWNVESDNAFTVAEDGRLVVQFDMRSPHDRWGRDPDRFAPLLENYDTDGWMTAGLALAESIAGVRLPEDWTSIRGQGVRVVAPPQDLVPDHYRNHPVLKEPGLAAILRRAQAQGPAAHRPDCR
jgi:hypothetical protein